MLKLQTRDIGTELETREATMRPHSFDNARRTVEVVVATGSRVTRQDARGDYDEILDVRGADLSAFRGAPVLNGHRSEGVDNIIGSVLDARVDGDQIVATVQLSERADLAPVIHDIREGIINAVSAGYTVSRWQDGTANGRRTKTAVQWTPREVSFVAVGADPLARTRSQPTGRASINRQIRELARRAHVPTLADDLIDREAGMDEARMALFDNMLTRGNLPIRTAIGADYTDPTLQTRAVADALYSKMTGTPPNGPARDLVHRSMIDLMRHTLQVNGVSLRNNDPAEVYRSAMLTRDAGMHSTSDFPIILADTMNRRLGELFQAADSGASAIVATGTARDFRTITEARLTSFPSLEPLNESGEIKWGSLEEEGETLAISSYARAIAISFQVTVNDDLGAVDRSIRDVAFATAMRKRAVIVAALAANLSDGKALFHADHGNLATSAGAPDETRLGAGRLAMMRQTAPGSTEPLGLSPSIILISPELQTTTEKLLAAINPATTDDVNVFSGALRMAIEPGLPDATQWFLFAAPGTYPVIRFLTLAGFEGPRFETTTEFDRLGSAYRVHWHLGAGPVDYRGAFKNAGA